MEDVQRDIQSDEFPVSRGSVFIEVEDDNGKNEYHRANTVMTGGRHWLARVLAGQFGGNTDFFVSHMAFGNGGYDSVDGREGPVDFDSGRTGLFSPISEGVISCTAGNVVDGSIRVTFTTRMSKDFGNGNNISEMGLMLKNGTLFAMVTFPPIEKNSSRAITVKWTVTFLSGS